MRNGRRIFARTLVLLVVGGSLGSPSPEAAQDQGTLQAILARSARYCERLKGLALHFVCHEEITIDIFDYAQKTVWRVGRGGRGSSGRRRRRRGRPA